MSYTRLFFHDYETFGKHPNDKASQFAGILTDENMNPIQGERHSFYCKPAMDMLPSPVACMLTRISPYKALEEGLPEFEFAKKINNLMSRPNTVSLGYNTLDFDDEVSRNLFYRNFLPVYDREWRDGNSRWDLINVVRAIYAFKPDSIKFPRDENGDVSVKLDQLAPLNGFEHENAHDALSDVDVTIAVAKLVQDKEPKLFEYFYQSRLKNNVQTFIDKNRDKPFWYISPFSGKKNSYCSALAYICPDLKNKNEHICIDLRGNIEQLEGMTAAEIRGLLFKSKAELEEAGLERPPLVKIRINKCPILAPINVVDDAGYERLGISRDELNYKFQKCQSEFLAGDFMKKLQAVFETNFDDPTDCDGAIYSGFPSKPDQYAATQVARIVSEYGFNEATKQEVFKINFDDPKYSEMAFRMFARNNVSCLTPDELYRWKQHCITWLTDETMPKSVNFRVFEEEMDEYRVQNLDALQQKIFDDLVKYSTKLKNILYK